MKKLLLRIVVVVLCVSFVAAFSLVGCKSTTATTETTTAAAETTTAAAAETTTAAAEFKHGKTVWCSMPYTGEYWWNSIKDFLRLQVEADPDGWTFNFDTADGSDTTQSEQIITYAQQADVLFVCPHSIDAQNEAIRVAEEKYHCPVIIYKDYISGEGRVNVMYNDFEAAQNMAKETVKWIEEKYGTTEGKTVISMNGTLAGGWKLRHDGFQWIKENHPEINFVEIIGGDTPEGWADVAESCVAGIGKDVVAVLAASDGPYLIGMLQALEKYNKLYYQDDPKHVFIASIDGKPSTLQWLRNGYVDEVYPQTPDSIAASLWQITKEYIIKDASYQSEPYKMPVVPIPLEVKQPKGTFWGGEDLVMTIDTWESSKTPTGRTPSPLVTKDNVNNWGIWGNSVLDVLGPDLDPIPTFKALGTRPAWCDDLLKEFDAWRSTKSTK